MKDKERTLDSLREGELAVVTGIYTCGTEGSRLRELGLTDGTEIKRYKSAPSGNPAAYLFRGAVIALRNEDAKNIMVEKL